VPFYYTNVAFRGLPVPAGPPPHPDALLPAPAQTPRRSQRRRLAGRRRLPLVLAPALPLRRGGEFAPLELRRAREALGRTQQQVADRLGVSQAYWALLESGKRDLTARLAERVTVLLPPSSNRVGLSATMLCRQLAPRPWLGN